MSLPVLLITGPVGIGKTAVAFETMELLEARDLPHAFFDGDWFTYFHPKPPDDRFGERFAIEALRALVPRLREELGIERLILARVLWERNSLDRYRQAIPDAEITVVRLTAPLDVIDARIRHREAGSAGRVVPRARSRTRCPLGVAPGRGSPHRDREPRCGRDCARGHRCDGLDLAPGSFANSRQATT